ncbi:hypothetical protein BDU57DRAFT_515057 [Ampelomyces quisqualis]|uniref:Uncharacterized protein n=1 Tax=Ampelomyces quisqualis TaxID=50730 RepID=A0A6A5QWX3_AMPQU|nr:hypothetical protein BDU57DRAFT_515057 [Ampelomyces quisqualis]
MGSESDVHQNDMKAMPYHPHSTELSSQPPKYSNTQAAQPPNSPAATKSIIKPAIPHRNHSAPANMVAAILASPYEDLDAQRRAERQGKTLRERWRAFRERNFGEGYDHGRNGGGGSVAEWNVMGAKTSSGQPSSYRKKSKK